MFKNYFKNAAITKFGFPAEDLKQPKLSQLNLPSQVRDEIPTLNKFGYMKEEFDEFSAEFIEYAANNDDVVLELGTAYGWVVDQALKRGITIIASDLNVEHLLILLSKTDKTLLPNLYIYPARFPHGVILPANSIGAVLTSRMFHFLKVDEVEAGLKLIHRWLKPGGKLFFTAVSPYNYTLKEKFLPIYKARQAAKILWRGLVDNMTELAPEHAEYLTDFLHVFDIEQLQELLPNYGFKIDKVKLFDYGNNDSDGLGHVGFVATKV